MTQWLIDKSALVRLATSTEPEAWAERIERGLVQITTVTRLEVGYSARTAADLRGSSRGGPLASMPTVFLSPAIETRALEVQARLADTGHHRAPSVADLLIAAAAELTDLTLLHLDKHVELIAELTGQPVERLLLA